VDIRRLTLDEHALISDLYKRTYGRERSDKHQNWIDINPMGLPLYYGAFENNQLFGLSGLLPWKITPEQKAWQFAEVLVDSNKRKQGIFFKILTAFFKDIQTNKIDAPIYTLPNPSSEPHFHKFSELRFSQVPRWCLWLHPSSSPLNKLKHISPYLNFLLPKAPTDHNKQWETQTQFIGNMAIFLNWRFGPDNPSVWEIVGHHNEQACFRINDNNTIQIGLWPTSTELYPSFISHLVALSKTNNIGRIEWAGQASELQSKMLKYCGFRTSFLNKKTWRNTLFTNSDSCPHINRMHFDT